MKEHGLIRFSHLECNRLKITVSCMTRVSNKMAES